MNPTTFKKLPGRTLTIAAALVTGSLTPVAPAGAADFVGSPLWFRDTGWIAEDQAAQRILSGTNGAQGSQVLPADCIQFAGQIVFPNGNPFPGGQLPGLRIRCRNHQADSVERAPFIDRQNGFSTVFKRGQVYDLYWRYFMGGEEKFFTVAVRTNGPAKRSVAIPYRAGKKANVSRTPQKPGYNTPVSGGNYQAPAAGPTYKPPVTGPAFRPPVSDGGFKAPVSDGGFKPPVSGAPFVPPQTGNK